MSYHKVRSWSTFTNLKAENVLESGKNIGTAIQKTSKKTVQSLSVTFTKEHIKSVPSL